jgi:hypothetical protein
VRETPPAALTPARLMGLVWVVTLLLFYWGPIRWDKEPGSDTLVFLGGCIVLFMVGAAAPLAVVRRLGERPVSAEPEAHVGRVMAACAVLGLLGGVCVVLDKVVFGGLDFSEGLGNLRLELARRFDVEAAAPRRPLIWLGMALYSFSNVALLLYWFSARCRRDVAALVLAASFVPGVVALMYAGRSPAAVTLLVLVSASLVRGALGERWLPRVPLAATLLGIHAAMVVLGSAYIFAARAAVMTTEEGPPIERFLFFTEGDLTREARAVVEDTARLGHVPAHAAMMLAYFGHGVGELTYIVENDTDAGPYWGAYQFATIVRASEAFTRPRISIYEELERTIDRSGLYFTAWAGLYIDFGYYLSPLVSLLLGLACGALYTVSMLGAAAWARILLAYMYVFVLLTPVHSLIGWANGAQTLAALMVTVVALLAPFLPRLRPARALASSAT